MSMAAWTSSLGFIIFCFASFSAAAMDHSSPPAPPRLSTLGPGETSEDPPVAANPAFFEFRAGALFGIDGPKGDKEGPPDVNLELLYGPIGGENFRMVY